MIQLRNFTGTDDQEGSVEERGLLRDVEQCVRSAEDILHITSTTVFITEQSPHSPLRHLAEAQGDPWPSRSSLWATRLPVSNGASVALSQSDSRIEDPSSDGSEAESIADPEPDLEVGFTAEVYSTIIADLLLVLQRNIDAQDHHQAEKTCRTIVKHCIDRENNLGIKFDIRSELSEKLVDIYLKQRNYQKAKRVLSRLLQGETADADRKWRLYGSLASAYYGQGRLDKALHFAQRSLRGREKIYGQNDDLTHQAAILVMEIYERQGEAATADALRGSYCPIALPPPPPPKSALRSPRRRTPSPPVTPITSSEPQHPLPRGYNDSSYHQDRNHVRWAPDVWTNESGINAITESGRTVLIEAIFKADEEYVKLILKRGADVETRCEGITTPLMHTVTLGLSSIAEILLEHGAQPDIPTSRWTPLQKATHLGDLTMMRLLLSYGANIEYRSPFDFIPPKSAKARLKAIAANEHESEADSTSESGQGWTPLLRAAFKGDQDAVLLLLDQGAEIEARNPKKATPLMCACQSLHFATVDLLLLRGANVHVYDDYGWRPIHRALVNRSNEPLNPIVPRLLDHEADVNARCNYNKTPLHYAIERNDASTVAFLLSKKADIEARDIAERTPLHTAIECRLESMVRLLLEQGADATAMDKFHHDALAAANHAERKSPEIIALLMKHKKRLKKEISEAAAGRGAKSKPTFGERRRGSLGGVVAANATHAAADSSKKSWFGTKSGKRK